MTNSHPQSTMSVDASPNDPVGFSKSEKCELAEMLLAKDGKGENQQELSLSNSPETLTATQTPIQVRWKGNCQLNSEQFKTFFLKHSLLKGYKIDEDVKKAVENGDIEEYCKDLVTKLTKYAQTTGARVAARVVKVKDKAFAIVREECQRKKQGGSKDGNSEQKSFEAKLKSIPQSSKELVLQALASSDPMLYCNFIANEIHKTVLAIQTVQAVEEAKKVANEVFEAAKALQESKLESCKIDEDEMNFETTAVEKDRANSDCNSSSSQAENEDETRLDSEDDEKELLDSESTSSSQADEEEIYLETEDTELVENESNRTSSETNEDETIIDSGEDEEDLVNSESEEDREEPPIREQDDEHVIPTPPPPPPMKPMQHNKVDEIQENILELKKYQVNQLRKELNFAIARLTSEVIKSYEQACILQKHGSLSLEKSALDFIQNQETRKTFYIKEIATRVRQVLRMLSREPEVNAELQDLDETVKLLYFLQTSRNYYVDKIAVTTAINEKVGFMFNFLLPLAVFVIAVILILNGEWVGLIILVAVVLICMIKSWQAMLSAGRKRIQVFGRKKKAEKID